MSQPNIPPRLIRRYMNYMIVAALIWCFFGAVVSGPLQAGLLLSLQLSKAQIGFVMSLSLLFLPMQMIGALLQQRFFHRKKFWFWCILVHYSSFLGIALLAAVWLKISTPVAVGMFMATYALSQLAAQLSSSVNWAWTGDIVPPRESTAFWNRRNGLALIGSMVAGIVMGNYAFLYRRHFINFQDSLAWIMQIGMFLILGLLVNPHELPGVFPISFLCSVALIFIARPLAVFLCLLQSEYTTRDKLFISWAGFKGAVPIILATYPMMYNFPNSGYLFNLIFFLVILSVLVQGNSLPWVARKLGLYREN